MTIGEITEQTIFRQVIHGHFGAGHIDQPPYEHQNSCRTSNGWDRSQVIIKMGGTEARILDSMELSKRTDNKETGNKYGSNSCTMLPKIAKKPILRLIGEWHCCLSAPVILTKNPLQPIAIATCVLAAKLQPHQAIDHPEAV